MNKFDTIFCNITFNKNKLVNPDITVEGEITELVKDNMIYYFASAPADYRATYTGSGLPFYNQIQAFDNTPNTGTIKLTNNRFSINLTLPNSYMIGLGSVVIPPTLYIKYINLENKNKVVSIELSKGIPFRHLTYPIERHTADFYATQFNLPVRSQEQIIIDSSYPKINDYPKDYFGLRPPL